MDEKFARGRSAEIFHVGDGKVMKLFFADYPKEYAEKEYRNTKAVADLGCTGLNVYEMVEQDGRFGFVMDQVDGVSQNDMPAKKPLYLFKGGRDLARCHVRIQKEHTKELDDVRAVCVDALETAPFDFLTAEEKAAAAAYINALPEEDTVLHLDFHTGNVLVDDKGECKVIDWATGARGNRAVEESLMQFLFGPEVEMFPEATPAQVKFFTFAKGIVAKRFFKEYQKLSPISQEELDKYRLLAMIIRRSWDIESEKEYLTKTIRELIQKCAE